MSVPSDLPEWYFTDNGFSSYAAMDRAHNPIVQLAVAAIAGQSGNVLDLGCGNGVLLNKICEANAELVPFGIDHDSRKIDHARTLFPTFAENFMIGDIFSSSPIWWSGRRYALAILMPGRLLEVTPQQSATLKARLKEHCDRVLVYAYDDWLAKYGSLESLARAAGLLLLSLDADATASLASFGTCAEAP